MTHTADDMHDDAPMTQAVSAEAVAGLAKELHREGELLGRQPELGEAFLSGTNIFKAAAALTTLAAEVEALRRERDRLDAEVERYVESYKIAHDQAMSNGQAASTERAHADSLAAELAQCREALEPFAAYIEERDKIDADIDDSAPAISYAIDLRSSVVRVTFGDFRRARTALKGASHEPAILSEQGDG